MRTKEIAQMALALKMEEAAMTVMGIYFLSHFSLGLPIWIWFLLFFSPDISMLGYLINNRFGAYVYNLFHHRAIALIIVALGLFLTSNICTAIGILLFSHSSFDRMMGYGLKFTDNFKNTSLGLIGKLK